MSRTKLIHANDFEDENFDTSTKVPPNKVTRAKVVSKYLVNGAVQKVLKNSS